MRSARFIFTITTFLAFGWVATPLLAAETPGISVSVSVSPTSSSSDTCLCTAEIIDLSTNKLVASPKVTIKKGDAGKVTVGDHATFDLIFNASIDQKGSAVTYSVTYLKNEKVTSIQKGSLSIH